MNENEKSRTSKKEIEKILSFIESIEYGSVSIYIQNGKIVQIEKNEKVKMT